MTPAPDTDEARQWHDFGVWVQGARLVRGLHRTELKHHGGPDASTVKVIEDGGRVVKGEWQFPSPTDITLIKLARSLGQPREEVFSRAGRSYNGPPAEILDGHRVRYGTEIDHLAPFLVEATEVTGDEPIVAVDPHDHTVAILTEMRYRLNPERQHRLRVFYDSLLQEEAAESQK